MPGFVILTQFGELFDKRIDYIIVTSEDHRSVTLTEEEVARLGEWAVDEDYEDVLRKYVLLDKFGQRSVETLIRSEFVRCQEQATLNSSYGVSISVRI